MALSAQSLSSMAHAFFLEEFSAGPKIAPPTIPPIVINPDHRRNEQQPDPAIDPHIIPAGPPLVPPPRPAIWLQAH
jgi:hypothetical protein